MAITSVFGRSKEIKTLYAGERSEFVKFSTHTHETKQLMSKKYIVLLNLFFNEIPCILDSDK